MKDRYYDYYYDYYYYYYYGVGEYISYYIGVYGSDEAVFCDYSELLIEDNDGMLLAIL